jgi:hypothetical protein
MRIVRCPRCEKTGGYLVFRKTKTKLKYPYVGHYDSSKKSRRKWCSLTLNQLNEIEFSDKWFGGYVDQVKLARRTYLQKGEGEEVKILVNEAGRILEKNHYLIYRIADRVTHDIYFLHTTDEEIMGFLEKDAFFRRLFSNALQSNNDIMKQNRD